MAKALWNISMGNLLSTMAQRYPAKIAVIEGAGKRRRCRFKELNEKVNMLSHGLMQMGLKKGDFVSILLHNCLEFVEVYNALAKVGGVASPLVYRLAPHELTLLINNCDATTLIFGSEFTPIVDEIKQRLKSVKHYVCIGEGAPSWAIPYEDLSKGQAVTEPDVEICDDDPFYLNYTSGTTGLPKAVVLNHYNNVIAAVSTFNNPYDIVSQDVILCGFPLYGRIGMGMMSAAIIQGARQVIMDFEPKACLEAIEVERVTFLMFAPIMSYMMLQVLEKQDYDLTTIRGLSSVGAPITKPIYEGIVRKITPNVYDYSGTQETASNYVALPHMKRVNYATLGTPNLFTKVRIIDDQGNDVPPGQEGEIITKTAQGPLEYFKDPQRTKGEIKEGWFYVRDVGHFDEHGWIYLTGRTKDMIKTGGQQVMAPEVEEILMAHPAVADCAIVGVPDEVWGEAVTAIVVPKEGTSATEEELIKFCRDKMAHFKAPKMVKFITEIPRTPTGKVQKFVLVNQYSRKQE